MVELYVLVVYDIKSSAVRNKIADIALDYGLARIQFSAFMGKLSPNLRTEMFLKMKDVLGKSPGRILAMPICARDYAACLEQIVDYEPAEKIEHDDGTIVI